MPLALLTRYTVGLICKAFLNIGFGTMTVNGLPIFLDALRSARRHNGQGILTVSNHISVLDDPLMWGILPVKYFLSSHSTRWALGASDIMFTNPVFSAFFRRGQVLETHRGMGIYQTSVDVAIGKLNQGGWVHLFPEGKVNQPPTYRGVAHLPRFKWGIGRILMETDVTPVVLPMWLTGFENMMPEGRRFPYKFFPRLGVSLGVTFGDPIPLDVIKAGLLPLHLDGPKVHSADSVADEIRDVEERSWSPNMNDTNCAENVDLERDRIRSNVTALVQRAVEALGREVSGSMLK